MSIIKHIKNPFYYFLLSLSGILLFIAISAFVIKSSVLSPGLHKTLFEKNDVYSRTYNVIKSSINSFTDNIKKLSPKEYEDNKSTFGLLQQSVTPAVVRYNIDTIRDETFMYFDGQRSFLPDIYLKPSNTAASDDNSFSLQAFSKLEKINLSAIFHYINRSDLTDWFASLRFINYTIVYIPLTMLILVLLLLATALLIGGSIRNLYRHLQVPFTICAVLCLITTLSLTAYSIFFIPGHINALTMSIPLDADVLTSYIRGLINNIILFFLISGLLSLCLAVLFRVSPKIKAIGNMYSKLRRIPKDVKAFKYTKYACITFIYLVAFIFLFINISQYKAGFDSNDFSSLLSRFGSNVTTQVVSAKNDNIYTVEIKLVDPKSTSPLAGIPFNISGKSLETKKEIQKTATTDSDGTTKIILDEGSFLLSFFPSSFPEEYKMPSPFFFDLKSAGTTSLTVNIDKIPEDAKPKIGIAEIEVLDAQNNPVPDVVLSMPSGTKAPGSPDKLNSSTNSEGIAVFKVSEGIYDVTFTDKLPKQYVTPHPLNITIIPNSITRFTVKLVEDKKKTAAKAAGSN